MKILFTGVYSHLYGGLERFAERAKVALEQAGHTVTVTGDPPADGEYDFVLMQKIPPKLEQLRDLKRRYGEKLHFYAHDHEAYCLRRHYYDPFRRNCDRTYSPFPCRLCAAVTRPEWIRRALTRDMIGFNAELREVKAITPANYIRENLIANGFPPERVKVVYPLFGDFKEEPHKWMPTGELRILFMGQLIAGKGVQILLEAMSHVNYPSRLNIVGTGRDEKKLRKFAKNMSNVVFHGWQENAQRFFADADICVVPSLWNEPFGTVGAEALSHGVPVVTFDVGGLSDWLKPGETGYFPEDDHGQTRCAAARNPFSLAAAIDRCADRSRLAFMSAKALAISQRLFDKANFLRDLLKD